MQHNNTIQSAYSIISAITTAKEIMKVVCETFIKLINTGTRPPRLHPERKGLNRLLVFFTLTRTKAASTKEPLKPWNFRLKIKRCRKTSRKPTEPPRLG